MAIYLDVMACNQICDKLNSGLFRSAEIRVSSPHLKLRAFNLTHSLPRKSSSSILVV